MENQFKKTPSPIKEGLSQETIAGSVERDTKGIVYGYGSLEGAYSRESRGGTLERFLEG